MSISSLAQEEKDNVNEIDSVSLNDFNTLKEERDNAEQKYKSLLHSYNDVCKRDSMNSIHITSMNQKVDSLQALFNNLNADYENANKKLANIASNFLYIPYEAYSVEKIAIPAFEAISVSYLREKNEIKYILLKNYKEDIISLLGYIKSVKEKYNNPFASKTPEVKNQCLNQLHNQQFYRSYIQYNDWKATYLGRQIIKVESILKSFSGSNQPNFDSIEKELNNCIKSTEAL